jgi:hypothetical protein
MDQFPRKILRRRPAESTRSGLPLIRNQQVVRSTRIAGSIKSNNLQTDAASQTANSYHIATTTRTRQTGFNDHL